MKTQRNFLSAIVLVTTFFLSCGEIESKQEKTTNKLVELTQEEMENVELEGILYSKLIRFSDEAKNIVHAVKEDSINGFTSTILNLKTKEVLGNSYWIDNGPDYFENGVVRFNRDTKVGLLNRKGEVVLEPTFQHINAFYAGYAIVGDSCITEQDGEYTTTSCIKYGIIDSLGNIKIPTIFEDIHTGKLPIGLDSNFNKIGTQPKDINYHLFYKKREGECNANEVIIYTPYYNEFSNLGNFLNGGFYEKESNTLLLIPLATIKNPKEYYYVFKNNTCGTSQGLVPVIGNNSNGKFTVQFLKDNKITLNSVTPGIMSDNGKYCQESFGEYIKVEEK